MKGGETGVTLDSVKRQSRLSGSKDHSKVDVLRKMQGRRRQQHSRINVLKYATSAKVLLTMSSNTEGCLFLEWTHSKPAQSCHTENLLHLGTRMLTMMMAARSLLVPYTLV